MVRFVIIIYSGVQVYPVHLKLLEADAYQI